MLALIIRDVRRAYARGGALETVVAGRTGLFFEEQTTDAMVDAITRFEAAADSFRPEVMQAHARSFDGAVCKAKMSELIGRLVAGGGQRVAA